MDDKMNRQLTAEVSIEDTPENLAQELVHYGFINQVSWEGWLEKTDVFLIVL